MKTSGFTNCGWTTKSVFILSALWINWSVVIGVENNPQNFYKRFLHSSRVSVCYANSSDGIIDRYFFEGEHGIAELKKKRKNVGRRSLFQNINHFILNSYFFRIWKIQDYKSNFFSRTKQRARLSPFLWTFWGRNFRYVQSANMAIFHGSLVHLICQHLISCFGNSWRSRYSRKYHRKPFKI